MREKKQRAGLQQCQTLKVPTFFWFSSSLVFTGQKTRNADWSGRLDRLHSVNRKQLISFGFVVVVFQFRGKRFCFPFVFVWFFFWGFFFFLYFPVIRGSGVVVVSVIVPVNLSKRHLRRCCCSNGSRFWPKEAARRDIVITWNDLPPIRTDTHLLLLLPLRIP